MQVLTRYFSENKAGIGGGKEEAKPVYRTVNVTLKLQHKHWVIPLGCSEGPSIECVFCPVSGSYRMSLFSTVIIIQKYWQEANICSYPF